MKLRSARGLFREMTALEGAILYEELECVQALIDHGAAVNAPFFQACENYYLDGIYALLLSHPSLCCTGLATYRSEGVQVLPDP